VCMVTMLFNRDCPVLLTRRYGHFEQRNWNIKHISNNVQRTKLCEKSHRIRTPLSHESCNRVACFTSAVDDKPIAANALRPLSRSN
jgi:hypothetical protein